MIEPTETESKETIDRFIDVMRDIARESAETPDVVKTAPHNTPMSALNPIDSYKELCENQI